jgi:Cu+-exporting ATPase
MDSDLDNNTKKLQIKIGGMQCSFCTRTIKHALTRMTGVQDVAVSLAHEEALVQYDPEFISPIKIQDTLKSLGYKIRDPTKIRSFEEEEKELQIERKRLTIATLVTLISLGFMIFMWLGYRFLWMRWVMLSLALFTMFVPGWYIKRMAVASLRRGILNQHVLLEFAAFGGLIGGLYGFFVQPWPMADFFAVSVFVTAYHMLSGYVSLLVRTRSSQAIKKLMELQPRTARIIRDVGMEEEIPIELIKSGDLVRIRSGESIPVDGVVVNGSSNVDQSLVTGESIPVLKIKGDEVIGGSINQQGTLVVEVSKVGIESFLQQIAQHIQEARALKPGIVILIDQVLKYFVWIVVSAAILAFLIWTVGAWLTFGEIFIERAILATLAVLVMGYPCALGMATPLAMIRGGGIAAQKGILMRTGEAFQAFKDVDKIVFDKTGTLTIGKPQVVSVITTTNCSKTELLSLAASIEIGSDHPLGKAVVDYALQQKVKLLPVENFETFTGQGVHGIIQNKLILVGNSQFISQNGIKVIEVQEHKKELETQGFTVIIVAENEKLMGIISVGDTLKEDARETIELLHSEGFDTVIITGDNWRVAKAIAKKVGIKEVLAEVLPQDKAAKIRELQLNGHRVAMVGDGINDAPALMQADIGIAIGAGSDVAIESADIILVSDRLKDILKAYYIGKSSYSKTVQNVTLAFGFNGIGVVAAISGLVHPIWAMIAMALSVSTILLNSFGSKSFIKAHRLTKKQQKSKLH